MNEKNLEAIQRKLYDIEFTSVYVLDIETKNLIVVKNLVEELPGRNGEVFPYRKHIDVLLRDFLVQDDEEDAANDFILENILLSLKKEEKVIFSHSMIYGGRLHRFRWDYCYKDETKKELIIVRIDITEFFMRSYRLQTDLTEQLMKEKAASIAKSEFLSTMSHDIRTPLNAILNMLQLTRDDFLGIGEGDVLEDLDKIDIASTFLLGLLNDVLDMSSIENGQMELLPDVYEFAEFVSYIDCIFETLCHEKKISFIFDYGKTDFAIYADKIRFNQIFFNVLSNAVKYTPEGGSISFRLYDNEVIKNKLYWKMEISDTGCGMSEEFQQKMFLPFEREKKTEHAYEGAGLGLPIVKKIVDLMGG
ncbi:MAG TPA: HAMP domain-containing sensor histidine kinase, partial [Lachnospiraceae bacterium]|nr:HAMP domain-containing sensor histidine kinase [Lachnospiraceae bacterium]